MIDFIPGRAYMIMSNHSSLYDIPLIFESLPGSVRMLAKKELYKIPLFGFALETNDFVSIDRHNRHQAHKDLQQARKKMEEGIILWAAPEGTRSLTGALQPFKKGIFHLAMETEAIIIPVGIRGIHEVLPAKTLHFTPHQTVSVHIGAPIDSREMGDRVALMETVAKQISLLTELPLPSDNKHETTEIKSMASH